MRYKRRTEEVLISCICVERLDHSHILAYRLCVRQEVLWSRMFVCLPVCSFVRSSQVCSLRLLRFVGKFKSGVHGMWHGRSASVPNVTVNFWEVKVKVKVQGRLVRARPIRHDDENNVDKSVPEVCQVI